MEIRIYRDTNIKKFITVNEESIEIAQKMNARGEYDLLWESPKATNHIGDEFSYAELPHFDDEDEVEKEEVGKADA